MYIIWKEVWSETRSMKTQQQKIKLLINTTSLISQMSDKVKENLNFLFLRDKTKTGGKCFEVQNFIPLEYWLIQWAQKRC